MNQTIRFKNSVGNVVEGKVVAYNPERGEYRVYVSDATGGYHTLVDVFDCVGVYEAYVKEEEEVSKPHRYNKTGKLECWDVIIDQDMDFLEGSVLKYLWRHKEKKGSHDLKKAVEYLNKMIAEYDTLYGKK